MVAREDREVVDTQVQVTCEPAGEPVYVRLPADDVRRAIHMPPTAEAVVDRPARNVRTGQFEEG